MGMAASQARFLALTARKTNTEYEGQQVNQQRTALANQSAGLFNEMLELSVPTPPIASDYSKSEYIFTNPSTSEKISLSFIIKNPVDANGKQTYTVDGKYSTSEYMYATTIRTLGTADSNAYAIRENEKTPGVYEISIGGGEYKTLTGPNSYDGMINGINQSEGAPGNCAVGDKFYRYVNAQTGIAYYINANEINVANPGSYPADLTVYSQQGYSKDQNFHFDQAELTTADDGTGRFTSIRFATQQDSDGNWINWQTMPLELQTVQDDDAFNEAMNEYNAKKALYDKRVQEIDAKTTIIQQQDRTLELHLDQLDTEQQAIQTEMDAVKKVIDKNIEETFKTFA